MRFELPKVYAVKHKDESVRECSRSGGIFTALSDKFLENNGVIYGCVLNEKFEAVHVRATNELERNKMRGSKYIQSKLGDTFKNVKIDLENGKSVLFSGTSCQVAGLRKFLRREYDNLICVDIVCHGVPSLKVWKKYLYWYEDRNNSKIEDVNFRNKKDFGWCDHVETIYLSNGKIINSSIFKNLFYGHAILRPSCYECLYKSLIHPGDITIADYWGVENAAPEFDDNKGVSLVLVNNEIGEELLNNIEYKLFIKSTKIEDSMQPPLKAPFPKPVFREIFWNDFFNKSFTYIAKKYGNYGMVNGLKDKYRKLKRKIKKILK